jgi:hypothetical protein
MRGPRLLAMSVAVAAGAVAALALPPDAGAAKGAGSDGGAARAANAFLASLPDELRRKSSFPLDSAERLNWNYVPMKRAGVSLVELDDVQAEELGPLLAAALSPEGLLEARSVIKHENILRRVESEAGLDAARRDPGHYYTTVFGKPAATGAWAWRFEGHHLSMNVTQLPGEAPIIAPLFVGANPARVLTGPNTGLRLLAAEEDLGRELVTMLAPERRKVATIADDAFTEIVTRNEPRVEKFERAGLAAADMTSDERRQLRRLIDLYLDRLNLDSALDAKRRLDRAGFEKVQFAWAGGIAKGAPHYYRIHGPTLLVEYDNTQNNANHIHTVYRDLERDFGGDALRAHYRADLSSHPMVSIGISE